ncbi:SURF1 family protein [Enemella sp. A6]|uniref:SURF1 family protein n=1 Tax=Enemella sp. A6 TaxID=3440152 RepID=UPI003EBEF1CD
MTRLWQVLLVSAGAIIASVMVFLGLWQMEVFQSQGDSGARARMAEPAVPLADVAPVGEEVRDGYGRTVTFVGEYLPEQQLLIPIAEKKGTYRVLTALERPDGSVVPVVRGVTENDRAPAPPSGEQRGSGVLLASELHVPGDYPPGQAGSVRLPHLATVWDQPIVPGYVTLPPEISAEQGLAEAPLDLPSSGGSARNSGYAVQWWVFAAFALGFSIYVARDLGVKERRRQLIESGLVEAPADDDDDFEDDEARDTPESTRS